MFYKFLLLLLILSLSICELVSSQESTTSDSDVHPECCSTNSKILCNCSNHSPKLAAIPSSIGKGTKSFDASNNDIQAITSIPETGALERLDLSNNKIKNISYDAFDNLDFLKVLILSHNQLEKIGDDTFEWNPLELRVIHLDNNKLEFIQHFLFYDLDQLFEIDLSHNEITFVHPHAFTQLKTLVTLKLNDNKLHTLDHRWFTPLSSDYLAAMDLTNNPWSCDCALKKSLTSIVEEMKHFTTFMQELRCEKGTSIGRRLVDVNMDDLANICDFPIIRGILGDREVYSGQTLKLQCVLDPDKVPTASLVWKAPNEDKYSYHNAHKYNGIEAHPNGTLVISSFRESDQGTYECRATNKKGSVTDVTRVIFKPENPATATSSEGPNLRLQILHRQNRKDSRGPKKRRYRGKGGLQPWVWWRAISREVFYLAKNFGTFNL